VQMCKCAKMCKCVNVQMPARRSEAKEGANACLSAEA
jgi:hypothetical protein